MPLVQSTSLTATGTPASAAEGLPFLRFSSIARACSRAAVFIDVQKRLDFRIALADRRQKGMRDLLGGGIAIRLKRNQFGSSAFDHGNSDNANLENTEGTKCGTGIRS